MAGLLIARPRQWLKPGGVEDQAAILSAKGGTVMITDKQLERLNNLLRSAWPRDAYTKEAGSPKFRGFVTE